MKKILYLSLVFLLIVSLNSCSLKSTKTKNKSVEVKNTSSEPVKDTWINYYSIREKDKSCSLGTSAIETDKNTFITAGYASEHDNYNIFIQEIDNSGNLICANLIELEKIKSSDQFVFQLSNHIFMFIGEGNIIEGDKFKGFITILKMDSNSHSIITAKKIFLDNIGDVISTIRDIDGNYIVCSTYDWNSEDSDIFLIKINQDGKILWAKTFGGEKQEWPAELISTPDGGAIVSGYTQSFGGDFSNRRGFVLKVNSAGECVFFKLPVRLLSLTPYPYPIVAATSFGYLSIFKFRTSDSDNGEETLLQLNKDGEVINSYSYGNDFRCYSIFDIGDEYIITSGSNNELRIGSMSDNGEIKWLKAYKDNTNHKLSFVERSIIKSKNNYLLVIGWKDFGKGGVCKTKQVIMKLSIDGNVGNNCQEIIEPFKIPRRKLNIKKIKTEDANKYPEFKQRNIDPKDFEVSEIPFKCKNIKDSIMVEKICGE